VDFDWISLVNDWITTHCIPRFNEDMLDMTSVASLISYVDLFITSLCQLSTGLIHFVMRIQTFNENTPFRNLRNQQAPQSLMKNLGELQTVITIQEHLTK
jgi:hypothetical protein